MMSLHTAMGAIRLGLAAFMALLSLAGCQTIGPDGNPIRKFGLIQTRDGAQLSYIEVGSGKPIVLIPDWSQSAEQFKHQLNGLGRKYHVFALDLRGHGASSKVDHGYRLYRLSADLHDFLVERGLKDVTLVGHTMGCAVAFGYWELYGGERIGRLVLVDPVLAFAEHPGWTERDRLETGAIIDLKRLQDLETSLEGEEALRATQVLIRAMFTERFSRTEVEWAIGRNMELPRKFASHLLDDYAPIDWRATVGLIKVPTLVIGGRSSLIPWKSQESIAQRIPGARIEFFEEGEGGSHFMFMENPDKFNGMIAVFVG